MTLVAETATLAHGYTMDEADQAARTAMKFSPWSVVLNRQAPNDRWDCAWFAVVEALYASPARPEFFDLVNAAKLALKAAVDDFEREHARVKPSHAEASPSGDGPRSGPMKFWVNDGRTKSTDFTERSVERLALPQVLALLTDAEYQVVTALAAHGSQVRAAAALGLGHTAFENRLRSAREKVLRAWLEGESPWALRKVDPAVECRAGHSRAEHGFRQGRQWRCRMCDRNANRRRRSRAR